MQFVDDFNLAIPSLELRTCDIIRFFCGLLPAKEPGSAEIATKPVFHDHGKSGGPKGLFSISGVKFTTARRVAQHTIQSIFGKNCFNSKDMNDLTREIPKGNPRGIFPLNGTVNETAQVNQWESRVKDLISSEAVIHLDDLIFRRTNLGDLPQNAIKFAETVSPLFSWDESRHNREIKRVKSFISLH